MSRLSPDQVIEFPTTPVERSKRDAARQAVDNHISSGMIVGVGSGSTVVYAVQRIAERILEEKLEVKCVPTSFQTKNLLSDCGIPVFDLSQCPTLDVAIDGADEVDRSLNCIKGGGACQTQEKMVAAAARSFVIIADFRKQSSALLTQWRQGIPVEVIPFGYVPVMNALSKMGGTPKLRMAAKKAGPVVTDNGNFCVDVDFPTISDIKKLNTDIKMLPGVVETGLFPFMAEIAYFGMEDGSVDIWRKA